MIINFNVDTDYEHLTELTKITDIDFLSIISLSTDDLPVDREDLIDESDSPSYE